MKYLHLLPLFLLLAAPLKAQVMHWQIRPNFTSLRLADTNDAIVSDSAGMSTIWDLSGHRLVNTGDRIMPLFNGFAASVSPDLRRITGIYRAGGTFTDLSSKDYGVAFGYPYFEGQYMAVRQGNEGFNLIDSKGRPRFRTPYARIYPFSQGLVSCMGFINAKKKTGCCSLYYDEQFREVAITFNGKRIPAENTQFLSTVGDDGRAIAFVGGNAFWFDASTHSLSPLNASSGTQVRLENGYQKSVTVGSSTEPRTVRGVGAEGEVIEFTFDSQGYPYSINYGDRTEAFSRNPRIITPPATSLRRIQDDETGLIGLAADADTLLPPQFTEVPILFGDDAIVCLNGKYGQVHLDREAQFQVQLNKSEDMAFLHHTLQVPIRVDMPNYVVPTTSRIISGTRGMRIDQASIQSRQNRNGSFAEFDCELIFPEGLSADSLASISYPIQMVYEGLTSHTLFATANAWHFKYFDVRVPTSEIEIKEGNVKFNFYIERTVSEKNFPFEVSVDAKGLHYTLDKISESYYQCRIQRLKEGDNSIIVQVTEQGCPPVSCPVDVTYKKPKPAQGTTTKKAETVDIKVKKQTEEKPKPAKKLIIPI